VGGLLKQGSVFLQTLRLLRSQRYTEAEIADRQRTALVESMRHAVLKVPYYRKLGISAAQLQSQDDLQRFPLLTKRILREAAGELIADGFDVGKLPSSRTSGSTGEPVQTYFDERSWSLCKFALKIRRTLAAAPPLFRRCLIVSEQTPDTVEKYASTRGFTAGPLYRERVLSLFEDLDVHRRVIGEFRPDMLYAFPSYLLELERAYTLACQQRPMIPWIFTSSEVLTPAVRGRIESAFQARVHDIYGCTEFKEVAWQCRHGRYHINSESVLVETSRQPGDAHGRIVLTTLCNRAMPLLRFDTGDLGSLTPAGTSCPCGRRLPQLEVISGREGDMISLPSGRRISPYLLETVLETMPGLHQYRIVQEAPRRLRVDIVVGVASDAGRIERCRRELTDTIGEPMDLSLRIVETIPRMRGGKHHVFLRDP
jgi:phenylacetate-coenzyme A ligase PaaK-like adenylate-forming protein